MANPHTQPTTFDSPRFGRDVRMMIAIMGRGGAARVQKAAHVSHGAMHRLMHNDSFINIQMIVAVAAVLKLDIRKYIVHG